MQALRAQLKKVIQDLYGLDFDPELTPSPDNIAADYSSNAPLKLAKTLRRPPMVIGEELLKKYSASRTGDAHRGTPKMFDEVKILGDNVRQDPSDTGIFITPPGFLNFTLPDAYLEAQIVELSGDFNKAISSNELKDKTVICEFSDPNPFKVLHVGHLYTSIVGDSISRLYEYAGAKVIRANFGGDVGLHVAKTMYILKDKPIDSLTIEDIAKCYIEGTAAYEDDEAAKKEITKLNKEIYKINADGMSHRRVTPLWGPHSSLTRMGKKWRQDPSRAIRRTGPVENNDLAELYWKGRELSYAYFRDFYNSIGIRFDKYYPESTVASLGLAKVKEQLEKGVYEMSDGAVIFNGDKYGLHTRVFINKEGVPTYEAKDVGLIFTKWQDYHFDKSIVITGNEQKDYMAVVLKSIEQYAPDLVAKTSHLTHGLVKLPGGVKMSSRKGNFLKAVDVLDMVKKALESEFNSTDETVSLAATKYAFLKYKMGGQLIFDPHESVKMTGNSGPYLLYSAVRAKKIIQKSSSSAVGADNAQRASICDNGSKLASEPRNDGRKRSGERARITAPERGLIKKLLEYRMVLEEAVTNLAPHKLANYLYELAQEFSRFYEHCEVIGSEHEAERIKLVKVYLDTMTHGLDLLGIKIPEEM